MQKSRGQQHLLAISKRRSIPEPVTDVLVVRGNAEVAQLGRHQCRRAVVRSRLPQPHQRSENDHVLTESLGLRQDIPRHLFQQLIAKASDETREKAGARAARDGRYPLDALVADVTASLHSKFGPASPRYYAAKKAVSFKHRLGELQESSILEYARARNMEETIVALSMLCSLPSDVVERALVGNSREFLLVLAKAHRFSWTRPRRCCFSARPHFTIASHELDELREQFERLHASASQEILAHYRERKTRISPSPHLNA